MKHFLKILIRFHFLILFVLIEMFCFYLMVNSNEQNKTSFLSSANYISGTLYNQTSKLTDYFDLRNQNEQLKSENARLHEQLGAFKINSKQMNKMVDTVRYFQQYTYTPAKVINNSTNKMYNYLTLNKGSNDGISTDMAVITTNGIVGVVRAVSPNFSSVISVLNNKIGISAKIQKNGYYGSVVWDGSNFEEVVLTEIPNHVEVSVGDTIITSGYSIVFPEGILIGVVKDYKIEAGGNFYNIKVSLSTGFKNLKHVYVVTNILRKEQTELENFIEDD